MTRGDIVNILGYEIMAAINYINADAAVVVAHNNSTHILIFVVDASMVDGNFNKDVDEGRFISAYPYFKEDYDIVIAYKLALQYAINIATGRDSDE